MEKLKELCGLTILQGLALHLRCSPLNDTANAHLLANRGGTQRLGAKCLLTKSLSTQYVVSPHLFHNG